MHHSYDITLFFCLPHSHEKIVAISKHVLPSEFFVLLSPQPTKAQVQTCTRFFQSQMKKHRRLKQMYDYKRRKRIN